MASINQREYSERGLNTPQFATQDPNVASTSGRMFQEIGDATSGIAKQLEEAHLVGEEAKARNLMETKQADILSRASQETDLTPDKQKSYHEELATALNTAADSISIPESRGLFKLKYSPKAEIAQLKTNSIFLKRYRDQARAEFIKSKAIQGSNYVTTSNVNEKSMYISELHADIDAQVQAGYMKKEEGEKEKLRTVELWNKNHMKNDLETRPQWLLSEAEKGEKGFYAGVNPAFRSNIVEQAKKRIHSLEIIHRNDNENDMMKKQISGVLTPEDVEESFLNKTISRSFYDKMNKLLDSPVGPTGDTDKATFYDLTTKLVDANTTPADAREALMQAQTDGKLSFRDFQKLYNMHLMPTEQGPDSLSNIMGPQAQGDFASVKALHDAQDKQNEDKKNMWHSTFKFIDHTLDNDQAAATKARQDLYDRVSKTGKAPDAATLHSEARNTVFEDFAQKNPEIRSLPKEGKVLLLQGKKWRYYPDRLPEEVK